MQKQLEKSEWTKADRLFHEACDWEFEDNDLEMAERRYLSCLEEDPEHAGALNNLGSLYYLGKAISGDLEESRTLFKQAIAAHPDDPAGYYNLALTLQALAEEKGDQDIAIRSNLIVALQLEPKWKNDAFIVQMLDQATIAECLADARSRKRHSRSKNSLPFLLGVAAAGVGLSAISTSNAGKKILNANQRM